LRIVDVRERTIPISRYEGWAVARLTTAGNPVAPGAKKGHKRTANHARGTCQEYSQPLVFPGRLDGASND